MKNYINEFLFKEPEFKDNVNEEYCNHSYMSLIKLQVAMGGDLQEISKIILKTKDKKLIQKFLNSFDNNKFDSFLLQFYVLFDS